MESDSEVIDDSVIADESFVVTSKQIANKNQTVFVAESEESVSEDECEEGEDKKDDQSVLVLEDKKHIESITILSSDDDGSRRGSIRRQSDESEKKVVINSSDEGEMSPEVVPKRRAPAKAKPRLSESFIGRKTKKRMIILDSDTDNSFIIEHKNRGKQQCLKDTPAKIETSKIRPKIEANMSFQDDDSAQESNGSVSDISGHGSDLNDTEVSGSEDESKNERKKQSHKQKYKANNSKDQSDDTEVSGSEDESNNERKNKSDKQKHNNNSKFVDQSEDTEASGSEDESRKNESQKQSDDTEASGSENESNNKRKNESKKQKPKAPNSKLDNQSDDTEASRSEDENYNKRKNESKKQKPKAPNSKLDNQSDDTEVSGSEDENYNKRKNESKKQKPKAPNSKLDNQSDDTEASCSEDGNYNKSKNESNKQMFKAKNFKLDDQSDDAEASGMENESSIKEKNERQKQQCNSKLKDQNGTKSSSELNNEIYDVDKIYSLKFENKSNGKISPEVYEIPSNLDDDDGPDEDQMTMSRATRMSILGFVPKGQEAEDSDDSDCIIQSDDSLKDKKSPKATKSEVKVEASDQKPSGIKPYLLPASFPNQVVYVKKHVRESEMAKLNGLREELHNIRYLLEHMEMESLPDGGARLIERLTALEESVRRQGDKVANMLVEPDGPNAEDTKDSKPPKELSWEEIQKASNAVQPRMFGKQAMATHMAERNLIMERLGDLHQSLDTRPPEHELAKQPATIKTELMPHQLHALAWLRWRETQRPPGGILADDMGLGKTITMISLIAQDKENGIDDDDDEDNARGRGARGGTLVVCPASLVQQWAGEVARHAAPNRLAVALHHGAARAAHPHRLAANDLVITTYNILQRETEKSGVLTKVWWRRVILDEAHVVRNHKSATSAAVSALRASRRWALTGTPLHNKDLDLFALLKFLKCTPFDDLTMWKKWIDNKSIGGEQRLSMIMRCVMLRRTKALLQAAGRLACLPPRAAHHRPVTLSAHEMAVYQKVLVSSKTLFAQYLHQRAEKQAGPGGLSRAEKDNAYALHKRMVALRGVKPVKSHEILVLLLRLRQLCCHCGLIAAMLRDGDGGGEDGGEGEGLGEGEGDPAEDDLLAELDKLSLQDSRNKRKSGGGDSGGEGSEGEGEGEGATVAEALRSALSPHNPVFRLDAPSAKITAVMDCLENEVFPNKGEKAVVVSQWTSVLRLVARRLAAARVRCVTLSGEVPVAARAALVDKLNDPASDVRVMLLSLCAGGVGLNLCGANHLLLVDPHWNPQLEQQAQDRIYRVGQKKHVHIYRFMCVDTVEQSIRKLQEAKLELAESVLTGARNTNASKLTIDDLKVLFNMGPPDT